MKTISFAKLGLYGRLGNMMFEIAGTLGLAEKHNAVASFPQWKYERFFKRKLPHGKLMSNQVKEKYFHFHEWDIPESGCDVLGYFQSEKYFPKDIKQQFEFTDELKKITLSKIDKSLFDKPTIVFQIRRGDYVGNPNYYQLSINYYIDALLTHFPDYENYNIVFFSDELDYCKVHFECLPNAYFTDGLSDIEQMCLATMCDHFIIPNSSYGWWCAYLGEKPHSKVIHCGHLQDGKLLEQNDPKDYWCERWTKHYKENYRLDFSDVTFTIPVMYDHPDRKKNLDLTVCMLQQNYNTNVIVMEQGGNHFEYMKEYCKYLTFEGDLFHRTKMLNEMAILSDTNIIVNYDCDVIIPPMQMYLAVQALRNDTDAVLPFDGRFTGVQRTLFPDLEKRLDIGIYQKKYISRPSFGSVGGCVMFKKKSFISGGMECEYMISYGPEDVDRWERFNRLGYNCKRIKGQLYHIEHWRGPDSCNKNPYFKANHDELEKMRLMTDQELREYVNTWEWVHPYSAEYYKEISEGSARSAKIIFDSFGIKPKSVLDVGCGVGAWVQPNIKWTGIDYNIPIDALYEGVEFIECDLSKDFPKVGTFDLTICMEVAEHLPIERAKDLVKFLCSTSNTVLFSAAIPYQGGNGHINEQWQTWWEEIFNEFGFYGANMTAIQNDEYVEFWYRQNTVLYTRGKFNCEGEFVVDYVLPDYYEEKMKNKNKL